MSTRAWIVPKDAKTCGNYDYECRGTRPKGSKFSLDAATGLARFYCACCKQTHETQLHDWKERHACKLCQYVRNVTVHQWTRTGEVHFNAYCDACESLKSAWNHFATGNRLQKKALSIYNARGVDTPTLEQYRKVLDSP